MRWRLDFGLISTASAHSQSATLAVLINGAEKSGPPDGEATLSFDFGRFWAILGLSFPSSAHPK